MSAIKAGDLVCVVRSCAVCSVALGRHFTVARLVPVPNGDEWDCPCGLILPFKDHSAALDEHDNAYPISSLKVIDPDALRDDIHEELTA